MQRHQLGVRQRVANRPHGMSESVQHLIVQRQQRELDHQSGDVVAVELALLTEPGGGGQADQFYAGFSRVVVRVDRPDRLRTTHELPNAVRGDDEPAVVWVQLGAPDVRVGDDAEGAEDEVAERAAHGEAVAAALGREPDAPRSEGRGLGHGGAGGGDALHLGRGVGLVVLAKRHGDDGLSVPPPDNRAGVAHVGRPDGGAVQQDSDAGGARGTRVD
mmetsp:Transcript_13971/g.30290  ORF Transcript_13971/g.30290 Transcript_13971/m.30290 type:complete len:217 (+) Transcript_13971:976-1626(+)